MGGSQKYEVVNPRPLVGDGQFPGGDKFYANDPAQSMGECASTAGDERACCRRQYRK